MTFNEFVAECVRVPRGFRAGQHAFAMLHAYRPDLSMQVVGKNGLDPFYSDKYLPAFFEFVGENW